MTNQNADPVTDHDATTFPITVFNVETRRLKWTIGVSRIALADIQCGPDEAWLIDNFHDLRDTHFVDGDAQVVPRTPEARAAGLYIDEADELSPEDQQ
jgi:hypothetical protein